MVEIRLCPECFKAFYIHSEAGCPPCPHCGCIFIGRHQERTRAGIDFLFSIENKKRSGTMEDYSDDGAMIVYMGELLIIDTDLHVSVDDLDIHRAAKTVWTKKIDRSVNASGLRLL